MKTFPFISQKNAIIILRIVTSCLLVAHGIIRIYAGTVNGFGEFLNEQGFPGGVFIAWFITVFEIIGGLLLAAGYFKKIISFFNCFFEKIFLSVCLKNLCFQNNFFTFSLSNIGIFWSVIKDRIENIPINKNR